MNRPEITDLLLYPIKGCRGYSVHQIMITTMGLLGDREFAVIADGQRVNQKQIPELMLLSAVWDSPEILLLDFPGVDSFKLNTTLNAITDVGLAASEIQVYGNSLPILDMGDNVADWLSMALGTAVRLARTNGTTDWFFPVPEFELIHGKPQTKFVDAAPILLTNDESLKDLNSRLNDALPMNRFRPNVVVGKLAAYEEDELEIFSFPNVSLQRLSYCERCIVTTTNQETGEMTKEPLRTLSKYRKRENGYAGGIKFGIYLTALAGGELAVGDHLG